MGEENRENIGMWRRCKKMSLTEEYIYRERVRERE
jgi:hypothetical protein